jgi:uncharacterized protein (TIRG00374 family)
MTESRSIAVNGDANTSAQGRRSGMRYVRLGVTVTILAYIGTRLHWSTLTADIREAQPWWLIAAALLFGGAYGLAAVRWWFLLAIQDIKLPLWTVAKLTFVGQFFNAFMLGSIGGDLVRVVQILRYAPNQRTHAALSVVMDRVLGLLLLLVGSLFVLPFQWHSIMENQIGRDVVRALLSLLAFAFAAGAAIALMPFHRAPEAVRSLWVRLPLHHVLELAVLGFRKHTVSFNTVCGALGSGVVLTLVLVVAGCCVAEGIHIHVTFEQMLIMLAAAICTTSLPISVGGHGVREATFVAMFTALGVGATDSSVSSGIPERAVLFSVLFFAMTLVWSVVGGIVYVTFRHDRSSILGLEAMGSKGVPG